MSIHFYTGQMPSGLAIFCQAWFKPPRFKPSGQKQVSATFCHRKLH